MFEIYLISILNGLKIFLGIAAGCCFGLIFIATHNLDIDEDYGYCARKLKKVFVVGISLTFINVFIPTERQAYIISGVGGIVDYVKDNDTAKQLPDKVIIALDRWVDSISDTTKVKQYEN